MSRSPPQRVKDQFPNHSLVCLVCDDYRRRTDRHFSIYSREVTFFPLCRPIETRGLSQCHQHFFVLLRKNTSLSKEQLQEKVKKIVIVNKPRFSVTLRQREILTLLSKRQQWTVGEIAALLNVSSAAATKNVNRLERKHLVKRKVDEFDRRYILVSLTVEGHSVLHEPSD